MNEYEEKLLAGWEEAFKKGQLTLWIMLSLKDGPKHMAEIKQFIHNITKGNMTADDQSMYRALRRYSEADMISHDTEPGEGGPERKVYALTTVGTKVLKSFLHRNVVQTLYQPEIKKLIEVYDED